MRTICFSWSLVKKKLDFIHGRRSSCLKDKLWFQTKQRLQMLFSWNQCINIVYRNENYPFVLVPSEKKLDSIHGRSSSSFKDKLWFQTKQRLQILFPGNQRINILYPNENSPFFLFSHKKKLDSNHERSSSHFKDKLWFQTKQRLQMLFSWNQRINVVYPNENYPSILAPHEKKLDSIHG